LVTMWAPQVFVASNDATLQTTSRANRAYIVSGRRLIREMREVDKKVRRNNCIGKGEGRRRVARTALEGERLMGDGWCWVAAGARGVAGGEV
jgi:predicted RNA-binding protein with PIN domain